MTDRPALPAASQPVAPPVWVIANAAARPTAPDWEVRLLHQLHAAGRHAQIHWTHSAAEGTALAQAAVAAQVPLVVVVDGDGTVDGIAGVLAGTSTALGILPWGTMNNLAYSVGIPDDLEAALAVLVADQRQRISVGLVGDRVFLEAVSVGLEARLFPVGEAHRHQGLLGALRALRAGWEVVTQAHAERFTLDLDGERRQVRAWQITLVNAPRYGLGFMPTALTRMDDAVLEVVVVRPARRWGLLRHYGAVVGGRRILDTRVQVLRARQIGITSATPVPVAADGAMIGQTPLTARLWPAALSVVAPVVPLPPPSTSFAARLRRSLAPAAPAALPLPRCPVGGLVSYSSWGWVLAGGSGSATTPKGCPLHDTHPQPTRGPQPARTGDLAHGGAARPAEHARQ